MNTFVNSINNQTIETQTTNGMRARESANNPHVDLFYKIGASRGKDILPDFIKSYLDNKEIALRIAQWARDIRGGAGERQLFKDILLYLSQNDPNYAIALLKNIPIIGRFDDMLLNYNNPNVQNVAFTLIKEALSQGNGLCAKWMPRKGRIASQLRNYLKLTPKQYRQTIVNLSKTVEQLMSANLWSEIQYSQVPSLAISIYNKSFNRRDNTRYNEYKTALQANKDTINAGAVYPYDIIKNLKYSEDTIIADAMWQKLPNYITNKKILPMVDVSGSMECCIGKSLTAMDVAISLGLYISEKNTGEFKDVLMSFSNDARLYKISGTISQRIMHLKTIEWGMNTNLYNAFKKVLEVGQQYKISKEDMPEIILILSDMQFDQAMTNPNDSALAMIKKLYKESNYEVPKIVFWNLNSHDNVPTKFDKQDIALVSGFSPMIMKNILASKNFSPYEIMMDAINIPRYDISI